MSKSYPLFEPGGRCPKCAYDAVTTKYEGRVDPVPPEERSQFSLYWPPHPARLRRDCVRCSFAWYERPVDEVVDA